MRFHGLIPVFATLLCASCVAAGPGASTEADIAALAILRDEHVSAVNAADADRVLQGMVDDAVYLGPSMDPVSGHAALRALLEPIYQRVRPNIAMEPRDIQVVGDVAYEWGMVKGSMLLAAPGPAQLVDAKYVYIYRRQPDGSWRIVYDMYNDNAPSPQSALSWLAGGGGVLHELSSADQQAIATLRLALTRAIEQGDAAAYASLCEDDVQLLHSDVPLVTGKAALEEHNAAIFSVVDVTRLVLTPVVVYGHGDLAYEVGTQELAIEPDVPGFRSSRKYVHVLKRGGDGTWRFAALISNNSE